jgi:hypothetical protein
MNSILRRRNSVPGLAREMGRLKVSKRSGSMIGSFANEEEAQ